MAIRWLWEEEVAIRSTNQKIRVIHLRIATSSPVSLTNNVIPSASEGSPSAYADPTLIIP